MSSFVISYSPLILWTVFHVDKLEQIHLITGLQKEREGELKCCHREIVEAARAKKMLSLTD